MPLTVLCVDDDASSLLSRTKILEQYGYKAFGAQNGSKALQFVRANKTVCLVVLDYRMPDTDSAELARRMKRMRPMIPIMMLSDEEVKNRPLQFVDLYAEKGWPTDYFITLVETLTQSARSNR